MKKTLLLLLLLTAFCPSFANKIIVDKVENGLRFVQTKPTSHVFAVWETLTDGGIELQCYQNMNIKEIKLYHLVIYHYFDIEEGSRLLLKMENDSIMELRSMLHSFTIDRSFTYTIYSVSEEQLQELMNNNVVKIRVETESGNKDSKVYGKMFSKTIAKDYKLIEETLLKEVPKEKTFYDDF